MLINIECEGLKVSSQNRRCYRRFGEVKKFHQNDPCFARFGLKGNVTDCDIVKLRVTKDLNHFNKRIIKL